MNCWNAAVKLVGNAVCGMAPVARPLVTVLAAVLSFGAAPNFSRRAAASIIQVTGVSAGAAGALPANGLTGASRLQIAFVITVTGSRGAAVVNTVGCWSCVAGALSCDMAAVMEADGVTAAAVTGVTATLTASTGSGNAAAPGCAAVPEMRVPDASVAAVGRAGDVGASLSAPL